MASRIARVDRHRRRRAIRAREAELNRQLREIGGDFPQVASIYLIGANGDLLVVDPCLSGANRVCQVSAKTSIAAARRCARIRTSRCRMLGTLSQTNVFNTSIGRIGADSKFLGVVSVALRSEYFSRFYRELTNGDPSLALSLYRAGSAVCWCAIRRGLVRSAAARGERVWRRLARQTVVGPCARQIAGRWRERLVAFLARRRLSALRVECLCNGLDRSIAWRRHFIVIAALTCGAVHRDLDAGAVLAASARRRARRVGTLAGRGRDAAVGGSTRAGNCSAWARS